MQKFSEKVEFLWSVADPICDHFKRGGTGNNGVGDYR